MAIHKNIDIREQPEYKKSWERGAEGENMEATGEREEVSYTGEWEALRAWATENLAAEDVALNVTYELTRREGGMGELRITREVMEEAEPSAEGELGTEENPQYTVSSDCQPAPILSHPMFENLTDTELQVLKELMDGVVLDAIIEVNGAQVKLRTALDALSGAAKVAANYLYKGQQQYLEVHTEATARWRGTSNRFTAGTIATPPNAPAVQSGREWLCVGTGSEKQGDEVWQTAKFRLSAAGGWDRNLYGN